MKTFIYFVLLIISISYANEQKTAVEQDNARVSIYLHPFSTYVSIRSIPYGEAMLYLTAEVPFSLSNSLIIRPSLFNSKDVRRDIFRLGSDIGFRHHLFRNGEGLYLQGQIGIFYYKHNIYVYDDQLGFEDFFHFYKAPRKTLWLDVMGYVGYSLKFSRVSIFTDIGIGKVMGMSVKNGHLWPDMNLAIGIPF